MDKSPAEVTAFASSPALESEQLEANKQPLKHRSRELIWDSWDRSPEERKLISKIDFFILSVVWKFTCTNCGLQLCKPWAGFTYFSKNLNSNNLSNAYVSGMKEDLNVVGNQYQSFTTMWTIGYVVSQIPSQMICTRVRLSYWCPSWELFWVVVTFATASVRTSHQLYACRFLVGLGEGTFYPAVHTVLGAWYTQRELAKRACIFFASAFVGSMFSGYLQAALYTGMDGAGGLAGWRWLFIFDGVITFPMALWGFYALPDLPSNTKVKWLTPAEKELALLRAERSGKQLDEPFTWQRIWRVSRKWHFWVYTAYYTFFICSENIGGYMNLWLKSLRRYSVPQINTYPTATNAVTIVSTLCYGWVSDGLGLRAPIVYFSLIVCFFAAMNLAIWDGVPFGLNLERKFILGTTNSVAYAFNAWIPLLSYDTNYAPRYLVGNSITAALIVCAACTLTLALYFQRRDASKV